MSYRRTRAPCAYFPYTLPYATGVVSLCALLAACVDQADRERAPALGAEDSGPSNLVDDVDTGPGQSDARAFDGSMLEAGAVDSGDRNDGDAQIAIPCERAALGEALVDHACFHAVYGPFQAVIGKAYEPTANVSRPHTAFQVSFEPGERGYLRFESNATGAYALFTSEPLALEVIVMQSGARVRDSRREPTSCKELPFVHVFELETNTGYALAAEDPSRAFMLVIEALAPFAEDAWRSSCACTQLPKGAPCSADTDCCSGLCLEELCADEEMSASCQGASLDGATCAETQDCCSGNCDGAVCVAAPECRSSGPCQVDSECCKFCHDADHCH